MAYKLEVSSKAEGEEWRNYSVELSAKEATILRQCFDTDYVAAMGLVAKLTACHSNADISHINLVDEDDQENSQ